MTKTASDCRMAGENIVVTLVYSNSAKWLWWNDYKICKAKRTFLQHWIQSNKKKKWKFTWNLLSPLQSGKKMY